MNVSATGWIALSVSLAAPVPAAASDHVSRVGHHRALRINQAAFTAQVDLPGQVDPPAQVGAPAYTTSHGRLAPTSDSIFTRDAEMCNVSLCIGY
jgi:hypothetical protein